MLGAFLFYYEADQYLYLISAILVQERLDVLCPKNLTEKLYLMYILYVPNMYVTIKFQKLITRVNIPCSNANLLYFVKFSISLCSGRCEISFSMDLSYVDIILASPICAVHTAIYTCFVSYTKKIIVLKFIFNFCIHVCH